MAMNQGSTITPAKRRLLDRLKLTGGATAAELANLLQLTDVAIRQHLLALQTQGLVEQRQQTPDGRGRPATVWTVSALAYGVFPERHAELAVGLIEATRDALGEDGLTRIIDSRACQQIDAYRKRLPGEHEPLGLRVEALARERTAEGYMAEVAPAPGIPDAYLLIEHHCPICDAARSCVGLCAAELTVFQQVLGPDTKVERVQHVLSGDTRCVYRITRS